MQYLNKCPIDVDISHTNVYRLWICDPYNIGIILYILYIITIYHFHWFIRFSFTFTMLCLLCELDDLLKHLTDVLGIFLVVLTLYQI